MTKAMWGLLGVVLTCGLAAAQAPADKPAPKPDEKAGSEESLQQGGDHRPWAAGISVERQKQALLQFREGNTLLNQGLFARASEARRRPSETSSRSRSPGATCLRNFASFTPRR